MKCLLRSTRFWVICFLLLLLGSAAVLIFMQSSSKGTVAVITQDGKEIERVDLDSVEEPYTMCVDSDNGGYNIILIEHQRISVIEASCPDHVCVEQGKISNSLTPIVCLPNKLIIQIERADNELPLDAEVK